MNKLRWLVYFNFLLKLLFLVLFSSDYKDHLFLPFIDLFSGNLLGNPWEIVYQAKIPLEFPYPPLTLWVMTLFYIPFKAIGLGKELFILPLMFFDVLMYRSLRKMAPAQKKKTILFYLYSPIVIFSTYMHSQLDMISISLLVVALYFLFSKRSWRAIIFLGLAAAAKSQIFVVLPLAFIYFLRNRQYRQAAAAMIFPVAVNLLLASPYLLSPGYIALVLNNHKQNSIFDSFVAIEEIKVYLPFLAILVLYGRFASYRKINFDLLANFIGISFTVFLMLVKPSPGWYLWIIPFFTLLLVNQTNIKRSVLAFGGLSTIYLVYFLGFHNFDYHPLTFRGAHVYTTVHNEKMANVCFTALFAAMLLIALLFYKTGIRSNEAYRKLKAFAIGIGGDSGSGKSSLLEDLKSLFGANLLQLEGDGEHRWERGDKHWQQMTHLDPRANLLHAQAQNILSLKDGKPVYRRDYDHHTGKFTDPILLKPADFVLISGLHPFYLPIMRKVLDLKIFMDPAEPLRQHWKVVRDTAKRGYSKAKILEQIQAREEDRQRYITPQLNYADLIFRFFSRDEFDVGNPETTPKLSLQITLDASFHLEAICSELVQSGHELEWGYSDNLKHQVITLHTEVPTFDFYLFASKYILNSHELVSADRFSSGYRGFLQFISLFIISQKLRSEDGHRDDQ